MRHAADPVGDPPERLARRAAEPVAAAQRDDGRAGLVERLVGGERVGDRRDRRPVADPDDRAVADRGRAGRPPPSRPIIRRLTSSGPTRPARDGRPGARSARRSSSPAARLAAAWSTIRISTMPSARARFRSRETCGRVTPSSSATRDCVSPSS